MDLIPEELIGSTYEPDELVTALYLENAVLKRQLQTAGLAEQSKVGQLGSPSPDLEWWRYVKASDVLDSRRDNRPRHLVIANEYPDYGNEYANGFVHRRVKSYLSQRVDVDVVTVHRRRPVRSYEFDGVRVISGYVRELAKVLREKRYDSISVHFFNREMWSVLEPYVEVFRVPLFVFIHGFEADRWIRRAFAVHNREQIEGAVKRTFLLQSFWQDVVAARRLVTRFVFVSKFWRKVVEEDMDVQFPDKQVEIIHNCIDDELFRYVKKNADQRFQILWVRSAATLKYGPDMAVTALREVLSSRFGDRVAVTVIGDGEYFSLFENEFADDARVSLTRGYVTQPEIAELHRRHGLFLVPTRLDSQGVSRDEAMASGLVPVTNAVTAVPEFVDEGCALLAAGEDGRALGSLMVGLMGDPARFLRLSEAAALRVRAQSSMAVTAGREMALMGLDGAL